ncbi:MAG TPA: LCP family protein [Nocardioides sp.]|nr:LCP family protein [Nocardioides sp.]
MTDTPDSDDASSTTPRGGARRARRVPRSVVESRPAKTNGGRGKRRAPRKHTVAMVITATLLALAMSTAVSVVLIYNHWNGNLDVIDVSGQLEDRPDKKDVEGPQEPVNILVMGSDTREGAGNNIDGLTGDGERSDTTILLHLSANREFAYGISIPRDTMVDRPTCYAEDGSEIPGDDDTLWNVAFSVGGPACTIQQFEQLTDIRIDNYVVLDFQGFREMVDSLDGVEVCIPEEIYDPEHQITLEEGTREVMGEEALSYVRVRYTVGDGSDPHRIRRQQAFMASMINKAISAGMLVRPDRMVSFLNAVTDSLQTDFENIGQLADIGRSFQGIGLDRIKFVTTPWEPYPADPNRIQWTTQVGGLWDLVLNDQPLSEEFAEDSISAADDVEGSDSPSEPSATDGGGGNGGGRGDEGLSQDERAAAGLCT